MSEAMLLLGRIGKACQKMAALADALDWDLLVAEWPGVHADIARWRQIPLEQLTGEERAHAAEQIAELLEFQQKILARVVPWMEQARPLLDVFRKYPLGERLDS
jgi:hypothetical protein